MSGQEEAKDSFFDGGFLVPNSIAGCAVCDKGAHFGIKVSHSHRRSNKMWKSNVKSVKVKVNGQACERV